MTTMDDCLSGRVSPQVAIARLLLQGHDAAAIAAALDAAGPHPAVAAMRALVQARPHALDDLAAELTHTASGPDPQAGVAGVASFFDRAVRHSAEASVALYSLGDPAILAAATAEIVAWLEAGRLLSSATDVLDLGCGIGRVAAALAPRCRTVLGLDVSQGMVDEAVRRMEPHSNVTIRHTDGAGLDTLRADAFDLILAIDSFPYIVMNGADLARHHVQGAARALRPQGTLCVLNLSYRNDPEADDADARDWAAASGLTLVQAGTHPFQLWDGAAYVFFR